MLKSKSFFMLLSVLLVILTGCDNTVEIEEEVQSITISGTLENLNGTVLTNNMNVYIIWDVSSTSPDYSYVWGKGTINIGEQTFQINLPTKPTDESLNNQIIGVGRIAIFDDSEIETGIFPSDYPMERFVGIAGLHAVIFKLNNTLDEEVEWLGEFDNGYSVGKGIFNENSFDDFLPSNDDSVKITIDEIENIEIIDWT